MSERTPWPVNVAYESDFYVFDLSEAAVTGLVNANFSRQLTKDGVHSAVAVTVTEIDAVNQPGRYKAVYTPNAQGYWSLRVANATHNKKGWQDDIQVYAEDVLAGSKQTGDSFVRLGAPAGASVSADLVTIAAYVDTVEAKIGTPAGASLAADVAAVQADTDNIQTRLPTALVGGRMDSSVGAVAAGAIPDIEQARKLLEADVVLEKAAGQWKAHLYQKGTTTDLVPAKRLRDHNDGAITAATTPVASMKE